MLDHHFIGGMLLFALAVALHFATLGSRDVMARRIAATKRTEIGRPRRR
jgi:hypothetical protein